MAHHRLTLLLITCVAVSAAYALPDWPMFTGPSGNWDSPSSGADISPSSARRLWISEERNIPRGKLSSDVCGTISKAAQPMSAGTASLIVGGGLVFCRYFVPNGSVLREACLAEFTDTTIRHRLAIEADDVLLAGSTSGAGVLWEAAPRNLLRGGYQNIRKRDS